MSILEYENNAKKRKHLEAMLINAYSEKAVNFKINTVHINDVTKSVIQILYKTK